MPARSHLKRILSTVLPHTCVLCEARCPGRDLCRPCELDLPWLGSHCAICALPSLASPCAQCLRHPPPFSAVIAPLAYLFPVDVMISRFKNSGRLADGQVLAYIMADHAGKALTAITAEDAIATAVPLLPRKARQRGFNQAALLAEQAAEHLAWPFEPGLCRRTRDCGELKALPARQRAIAVKDVFEVTRKLHGERIILVDDVLTTGATVRELSRCLLKAGAGDVVVLAAARTPANLTG